MPHGVTIWSESKDKVEEAYKAIFTKEERNKANVQNIYDLFGELTQDAYELMNVKMWEHHGAEAVAELLSKTNLSYCVYGDFRKSGAYNSFELFSSKGTLDGFIYENRYAFREANGIFREFGINKEDEQRLTHIAGTGGAHDLPRDWLMDPALFPHKDEVAEYLEEHNTDKSVKEYTEEDVETLKNYFAAVRALTDTFPNHPFIENEFIKQNFDVVIGIGG